MQKKDNEAMYIDLTLTIGLEVKYQGLRQKSTTFQSIPIRDSQGNTKKKGRMKSISQHSVNICLGGTNYYSAKIKDLLLFINEIIRILVV